MDFPGGSGCRESASNVRDLGSIPGLGRSGERAWQPTPVFLPGKSHGQRSQFLFIKIRFNHECHTYFILFFYFFKFFLIFFFLICSEFCHTLKWNGLEFTCLPHPDPPSHLPLHLLPPGLPRAHLFLNLSGKENLSFAIWFLFPGVLFPCWCIWPNLLHSSRRPSS